MEGGGIWPEGLAGWKGRMGVGMDQEGVWLLQWNMWGSSVGIQQGSSVGGCRCRGGISRGLGVGMEHGDVRVGVKT